MVMLYVGGQCVGKLPEDAHLLAEYAADGYRVELRDDAGQRLAKLIPENEPLVPWDRSIDAAEIERRLAGEFLTFEEMEKRLGWK